MERLSDASLTHGAGNLFPVICLASYSPNSSTAPRIPNAKPPWAVDVSMDCSKTIRATPLSVEVVRDFQEMPQGAFCGGGGRTIPPRIPGRPRSLRMLRATPLT